MTNLIIQLLSGAAGGNIAGNLMKKFDMGTLGNSIAGIVGGGLGGQLISMLGAGGAAAAAGGGGMDIGSILSNVLGGGVGGGVVMIIIGLIKNAMSGKSA